MQDELVKNYSVSPVKIRKAGLEEMQSLKNEEMLAQSRNGSGKGGHHSASQQLINLPDINR